MSADRSLCLMSTPESKTAITVPLPSKPFSSVVSLSSCKIASLAVFILSSLSGVKTCSISKSIPFPFNSSIFELFTSATMASTIQNCLVSLAEESTSSMRLNSDFFPFTIIETLSVCVLPSVVAAPTGKPEIVNIRRMDNMMLTQSLFFIDISFLMANRNLCL